MENNPQEFLITNSIGSFAMGSYDRVPRRKYHGLWISRAINPERPEHLLVDVLEYVLNSNATKKSRYPLVNYNFGHGAGLEARSLISKFERLPKPTWTYQLGNGSSEKFIRRIEFVGEGIEVEYEWLGTKHPLELSLSPLFSLRDVHSLSKENLALDGTVRKTENQYEFQPYSDLSPIRMSVEGLKQAETPGTWYKNFFYEEEAARGYPAFEDAFSPIRFFVSIPPQSKIHLRFSLLAPEAQKLNKTPRKISQTPNHDEFRKDLSCALNQFVYRDSKRPHFESVIAGYPWFSSWARDTFICIPGLSLTSQDPQEALQILKDWAPLIESVLFNKLSPHDVNASGLDSLFLWGAALQFLVEQHPNPPKADDSTVLDLISTLDRWIVHIFQGENPLLSVTDFGLKCMPGNYATSWMDAIVDQSPVTPRHGYPIEINSLFLDCIDFVLRRNPDLKATKNRLFKNYLEKVKTNFAQSFWVSGRDFIGDRHDGVELDCALRPNLLWAASSHFELFSEAQRKSSLKLVTEELLTPFGLRTLSPLDSRYRGRCKGDQATRDQSYHQGTVWPWLIGKYTDALLKIWDKKQVETLVRPVLHSLKTHFYEGPCPGQISEIFDGNAPHAPRGAPAQAWSVAETLRTLWLLDR
jgi:predicted glycogen debranching enzyme